MPQRLCRILYGGILSMPYMALQADVRQPDRQWLHFDDHRVTPVKLHEVLGRVKEVYILVYQLK